MSATEKRARGQAKGIDDETVFFRHERAPFFGGIGGAGQEKGIRMLFLSIHHTPPLKNRDQVISCRIVNR